MLGYNVARSVHLERSLRLSYATSGTEFRFPLVYIQKHILEPRAKGFDEFNATEGEHLARRLKAAFEVSSRHFVAGMDVLDVGCGRGEILRHRAHSGANAYGVDYAPVAVQMSKQVVDNLNAEVPGQLGVYLSDAKKLPFPTAYFDRVLLFDVVEHLHPWELHLCLMEVHRVLKPNGKLIVHTAPTCGMTATPIRLCAGFARCWAKGQITRQPAPDSWWM
ncbi:MAG UNVERIFIED_CONTAM: class I SAM-dependent methyltransferase [Anaerolineae bacterium]|jgi:ubiquinone/menaquinone biosynthesis C-methylase UbiE